MKNVVDPTVGAQQDDINVLGRYPLFGAILCAVALGFAVMSGVISPSGLAPGAPGIAIAAPLFLAGVVLACAVYRVRRSSEAERLEVGMGLGPFVRWRSEDPRVWSAVRIGFYRSKYGVGYTAMATRLQGRSPLPLAIHADHASIERVISLAQAHGVPVRADPRSVALAPEWIRERVPDLMAP